MCGMEFTRKSCPRLLQEDATSCRHPSMLLAALADTKRLCMVPVGALLVLESGFLAQQASVLCRRLQEEVWEQKVRCPQAGHAPISSILSCALGTVEASLREVPFFCVSPGNRVLGVQRGCCHGTASLTGIGVEAVGASLAIPQYLCFQLIRHWAFFESAVGPTTDSLTRSDVAGVLMTCRKMPVSGRLEGHWQKS